LYVDQCQLATQYLDQLTGQRRSCAALETSASLALRLAPAAPRGARQRRPNSIEGRSNSSWAWMTARLVRRRAT